MEQKRKVKSLIPMSESGELGIFSRFLIVLSCIFCFGTLLMLALCVSYVDAASINSRSYVYSGGIDENAETLYELGFTETDNLRDVKTKIYMKSNSVGKNNLYMEPYPIVVQKGLLGGSIGSIGGLYLNFLGGDSLDISSANISIIGGNKLTVNSSNSNATIFGGENNTIKGSTSSSPRVIVGGMKNTIGGANGVILGGEENNLDGGTSSILGGRSNSIGEPSTNVIVAGNQVETNLKNIFAFSSNGGKFKPNNENAFYLDVQKGLGLKMNTTGGVASSGAVSFGSVKGIGDCAGNNIGLIGLSGNCLYGCSNAGWQELGCFEQEWLTGNNFSGYCVGPVNDDVAKEKNRYARCHDGREEMYANVAFETKLWTGENCPDLGVPGNPCVYMCNTEGHYHYYTDPEGKKSGCKKDCQVPWNTGDYKKHGKIITGYRLDEVVCEDTEKAPGCDGVKAILQCDDGERKYITGDGGKPVYSNNSNKIEDIRYKYETCKNKENKCNTGVYQYTSLGIINWTGGLSCTNHTVENDVCIPGITVYSGRCYDNHTLVADVTGGICIIGENTSRCRCKPNQQTGTCLEKTLPEHAIAINTGFIQIASGDGKNNWSPKTKSYSLYTGNKDAECIFECESGYSYSQTAKKCLLNCEYNGLTYKNGQTISGYKKELVTCPNVCKPVDLTCYNGIWTGGKHTCKSNDEICSGYNFTGVINNAKCTPCTKYKGSLSGTCTTGDMVYSCECHYNPKDGYYVLSGTECVPATTGADCKGDEPIGSGNVTFPLGKTFKQTWSGGVHKWLPEEIKYHYGTGECGFRCNSGSSYIVSGNKCEGNECINHNFGVEGSYHFYTPSSDGIVGNTNSTLYESGAEAQKAYGNGEKCLYFCNICYNKVDAKCEPKTFTGTFWCKNNGNTGWLQAVGGKTQTFTYNVPTDVNRKCNNRSGYVFIGWSTNSGATNPMFTYGDKLTGGNYNSCSSTNFFAVYKCAQGYTGNGINCKKNSHVCTGTVPNFAVLVTGSAVTGLEESIDYELYKTAADAKGKACAYVCDSDHVYVETMQGKGKIVKSCKKCLKSLSTDQTVCVDDVICENANYVPYYDEKQKKMQCGLMSDCVGSMPAHGKVPENYQYVGTPTFGGVSWYCGKNEGKGCYFECETGYECSVRVPISNYGSMWASVNYNWSSSTYKKGKQCIDRTKACEPFYDVSHIYKGGYNTFVKSGFQYYKGYKEWTFITGTSHNDIVKKMKANKDDCLVACYYGSMYVTGATLSTYQDENSETRFCPQVCRNNQYFGEDGECHDCSYDEKPDDSIIVFGNAVRCIKACEWYENYNDSTDSCESLGSYCQTGQYVNYGSNWWSCYDCDGELTGRDDQINGYTECIREEQEDCPDYYWRNGYGECIISECYEGQFLNRYGYCETCIGELTGWNETFQRYTGCKECENTYIMEYTGGKCEYLKCNKNQILSVSSWPYGCQSCSAGKEVDKNSWSSTYGNYTKCKNICSAGYVYISGSKNPKTGTYCWPENEDPVCADGSTPQKDSNGAYYCLTGYTEGI